MSESIWEVIQLLPVYPALLSQLQTFQFEQFGAVLNIMCPFRLLYSLQVRSVPHNLCF